MKNKTKKIIAYSVGVASYGALLIGAIVGSDMSWWQPATAVVGLALSTFFGIEFTFPGKRD